MCPKCGREQLPVQPRAHAYRATSAARRAPQPSAPPIIAEEEEAVVALDAVDADEDADDDDDEDASDDDDVDAHRDVAGTTEH